MLRIAKTWDSLGHYFRAIQWARLLVEMRYVEHPTLIVGIAGESGRTAQWRSLAAVEAGSIGCAAD